MSVPEREIAVDYLARVEGEGAMYLRFDGDRVADLQFKIFEPPRFFEALLRGRRFAEALDITARICGICPVAYQTSAANALEAAAGVDIGPELRQLRRLMYCGEWIESHVLHVFMLHAPDFLGYPDGLAMAADMRDVVADGLRMKKIGNHLVTLTGGREIHPINVRPGGFYRVPSRADLQSIVPELEWALEAAVRGVEWVAGFPFPEFERDYHFVSLQHPDEYAIDRGRIVSSAHPTLGTIDIDVQEWPNYFVEEHVAWSNALHARTVGGGAYHVGPMARYSLNADRLHPIARDAARRAGLGSVVRNPFKSIVVRMVEVVHAFEEALRVLGSYTEPPEPFVPVDASGATGHGASEAPRGLLYHRYTIDEDGLITDAHIVPPTSQNQLSIEEDLRGVAEANVQLEDDRLQWQLEQAIRNYDPCISCATHFLDLTVDRGVE
jgi:coenzyme F420-reducing hydrogenase alpha subunit